MRARRLLNRLTGQHPLVVASASERVGYVLNPLICKVIGHRPQRKMHDTICERCRIVLTDGTSHRRF